MTPLRSLARASALYAVGNIAPRIGAFLLLPIYLQFLSAAEYGTLSLLLSLAAVLGLVYHLGMDGALMRLHFDVEGRDRARMYGTATLFTLALATGLSAMLALGLGPSFETLFGGTPFLPLGALALSVALAGAVSYVPTTLFRASGKVELFLLVTVGAFVVSSIVSIVLVVVVGLGAAGVLIGQLVSALILAVVALAIVQRLGAWTIDGPSLRRSLRLGMPLLPHGIAAWALRLADRWLIVLLIGLPALDARAEVGVYSVGYQLGAVVAIIVTSFNAAWAPYFYQVGGRPAGPNFYAQMTTLVMAGLLILAAGISILAPEIVAVIARPEFAAAADVLPVVAFASVLQGLYTMFVAVVFLQKRTGRLAAITFAAAGLNVALNVVLIPAIGIMGAAWATFGAYLFFAATTFLFARGMYPMRIDAARLAAIAIGGVAAVVVGRVVAPEPSLAAGALHLLLWAGYTALVVLVCRVPLARLRLASAEVQREAGP